MVKFARSGMRVKCIEGGHKNYGHVGTIALVRVGSVRVEFDNGSEAEFRRDADSLRMVGRLGRGA
jgi:hypothetical protein